MTDLRKILSEQGHLGSAKKVSQAKATKILSDSFKTYNDTLHKLASKPSDKGSLGKGLTNYLIAQAGRKRK